MFNPSYPAIPLPSFALPFSSSPSGPFDPLIVVDDDVRAAALKRTAEVVREVEKIRRSTELPVEMFPYVLEVFRASARELLFQKQEEARVARLGRHPMTMTSKVGHRDHRRILPGEIFDVVER